MIMIILMQMHDVKFGDFRQLEVCQSVSNSYILEFSLILLVVKYC